MNPHTLFCPNLTCPARGQSNEGNIHPHHVKEKRYRCDVCGQTFTTTKGTLFYRLKTDPEVVILVLVLMSYGCPLQAIVRGFELDERTVKSWWHRAGNHCHAFHQNQVSSKKIDLGQVQADEIKAKICGQSLWMAMAIMVSTRLWLGGVISANRDATLIQTMANQIAAMALCRPLLLAVDGLWSYITAFRRAFRTKNPLSGPRGQPKYLAWPDIAIVQVIKNRNVPHLEIRREIEQGVEKMIDQLRAKSQNGKGVINTAYIERLNATFRQRLAILGRRSRHLAHHSTTLEAGMMIVGCFYNFCDAHDSLRTKLWLSKTRYRWARRTPAIAAGLTDHVWTYEELLTYPIPPSPWVPKRKRGRPSKAEIALIERWCK